ncbi:unnamed protein product [Ixodes pacificus]
MSPVVVTAGTRARPKLVPPSFKHVETGSNMRGLDGFRSKRRRRRYCCVVNCQEREEPRSEVLQIPIETVQSPAKGTILAAQRTK